MATKPRILSKEETDWMLAEKEQRPHAGQIYCYFRTSRRKAESGYPAFEFGYCVIGEDFRVTAKRIVGVTQDMINIYRVPDGRLAGGDPTLYYSDPILLDPTADGYWRFISHYRWREPPISGTAELIYPPKESQWAVRSSA